MLSRMRESLALALVLLAWTAAQAEKPRAIVIDGKFDDWAGVKSYTDPAFNTHVTSCSLKDDKPEIVDHADADLLEYKFAHDKDNLYAYFRARGVIGRTQVEGPGTPAGRYYAIVTIDVDNDVKTGYWLHEGGFYPTSGGYDVNAEIEYFGGRVNTGHYINHECLNQVELDQAFLDQSSGKFRPGNRGPYPAGFVRMGPGTYKYYTEWVYHPNDTITFVRDKGPQTLGIVEGALSPDGHEMEMRIPRKGFMKDKQGHPIVKLGATMNISFSLEASGELAKDKRWASNTAEPIKGYVLEP